MPSFDRQVPACILQYQHMIHGLHEGKFKFDRTKAQRLGSGITVTLFNTKSVFVYVSMLMLDFSRRISLLSSMILGT